MSIPCIELDSNLNQVYYKVYSCISKRPIQISSLVCFRLRYSSNQELNSNGRYYIDGRNYTWLRSVRSLTLRAKLEAKAAAKIKFKSNINRRAFHNQSKDRNDY